MIRAVLTALLLLQFTNSSADSSGSIQIGIFEGNNIAVELSGEAASEIEAFAVSSKNIQCREGICRFDLDNNAKAKKPRLKLEDAHKKDQYYFQLEARDHGKLRLSSYSANGDPKRGTLVRALYDYLAEESKREGSKVKGEAITNHDYLYEGTHLQCVSYVSGDYTCELYLTKAGISR